VTGMRHVSARITWASDVDVSKVRQQDLREERYVHIYIYIYINPLASSNHSCWLQDINCYVKSVKMKVLKASLQLHIMKIKQKQWYIDFVMEVVFFFFFFLNNNSHIHTIKGIKGLQGIHARVPMSDSIGSLRFPFIHD